MCSEARPSHTMRGYHAFECCDGPQGFSTVVTDDFWGMVQVCCPKCGQLICTVANDLGKPVKFDGALDQGDSAGLGDKWRVRLNARRKELLNAQFGKSATVK